MSLGQIFVEFDIVKLSFDIHIVYMKHFVFHQLGHMLQVSGRACGSQLRIQRRSSE